MDFYSVIKSIQHIKKQKNLIDLSTGNPFIPQSIKLYLSEKLLEIASNVEASGMYYYEELDHQNHSINNLRSKFTKNFSISFTEYDLLICPGAQSVLSYLQIIFSNTNKKILFPAKYEYRGAYNNLTNDQITTYDLSAYLAGGKIADCLEKVNWNQISAIFISQPHNPTSIFWSNYHLMQLAEYISKYSVYLVLDETCSLPFASLTIEKSIPLMRHNIIHIYSFSKVGLAGERVGIILGNHKIISKIRSFQQRFLIHPSKIGQILAVSLIDYLLAAPPQLGQIYKSRHNECIKILADYNLLNKVVFPSLWGGGPFMWLQCNNPDEYKFFNLFLENDLAIMPGTLLSVNPSIKNETSSFRIGLGNDINELLKGMSIFSSVLMENL